ncbi:MAG: Rieske (2Fe-2S) protein [Verrucomicrobiae bacterium]|nr:Rieske (2Fe-2S) protein [Verrucomicrobiae bacterium]
MPSENLPSGESPESSPSGEKRRDLLLKAGSICAGCALAGVPVLAGLRVVAHPVTQRRGAAAVGGEAPFLPVATLDSLPEDGSPVKFIVRADQADAWSRFPNQVIGAVFLRRVEKGGSTPHVQAFNVVCPHLGCAVEFREGNRDYFCPCHNSAFELESGTQEASSPSARGLDELETQIDGTGHILVRFQNFVMGIADKRPV